jgi:eukaryotic-like serine/threonine-protein kinase
VSADGRCGVGDVVTTPQHLRCANCGGRTTIDHVTCPACGATQRRSGVRNPGTVLGSYRLLEVLGEGGMGVVYLAEHTRLGRRVALKTLRADFAGNPQAVRRFFGEARAVNKIRHHNIVEITDFVEEAGGDNYYIMELLRGKPLSSVIDNEGVQPLPRSVGIMAQVARALQAVHDAGIIHRDLKPDNVFLIDRSGQPDFVKLLDFGVAKLIDAVESIAVHSTAAGAILGTPEYMSPEQASGKVVDHRTDIYSFGVLLYELVTGVLPLRGANFGELVVKHLTVTPIAPSRVQGLPHVVPPELEDTILACMEKDEASRPERIDTVADQLEAIAEAHGWELPTYTAVPRSSARMGSVTGPIVPLRKTPAAGLPAMGHAPTLEIEARGSGQVAAIPASSGAMPSMPIAPRAKRWPLVVGVLAVVAAGIAFAVVNLQDDAVVAPPVARVVVPEPKPVVAPETIEIEITSTPVGADVVRLSDGEVLGQTPLTLPFARADRTETFELRLNGHVAQQQSVKLDRGSRILTVLAAEPPARDHAGKPTRSRTKTAKKTPVTPAKAAATPTPAKEPAKTDRSGVMDPFQ